MDPTLLQLLRALFQAHQEIDRLRAELQQRDQLQQEAKPPANSHAKVPVA